MTPQILKKYQSEIENLIHKYARKNPECEPIYDGIVDEEKYLSSKFKIMWVLKEAYDDSAENKGGWSLAKDKLSKKNLYDFVKSIPTFHTIVYATYSILNGFLSSNEMGLLKQNPEMAQVLNNIAFINVNKFPGGHSSNNKKINGWYEHWKPVLQRQLQDYEPDIIIFGNTIQPFSKDLFLDESDIHNVNHTDFYYRNNKLLISAYHPNQKVVTRNKYIDEIVKIVQEWSVSMNIV